MVHRTVTPAVFLPIILTLVAFLGMLAEKDISKLHCISEEASHFCECILGRACAPPRPVGRDKSGPYGLASLAKITSHTLYPREAAHVSNACKLSTHP